MQGSVLIVRDELIKSHPDIVKKLVQITAKSTKWIKENHEEAASIMAGQLQVTNNKIFPIKAADTVAKLSITPKTVLKSIERMEYTLAIDSRSVQEEIDFAVREGYIRKTFNASDILDLRFVNENNN
jgi:NitT/TauT family transport system substrate-binding protein